MRWTGWSVSPGCDPAVTAGRRDRPGGGQQGLEPGKGLAARGAERDTKLVERAPWETREREDEFQGFEAMSCIIKRPFWA